MTVLESLMQFFWSGVDVLNAVFQLLEPHLGLYLGLALWIIFCTGALNWVRLRKIILSGGWIGLLLIALVAVVVWASVAPPEGGKHFILGAPLSNFPGKMVYVTGLICIMFLCGSVQLALNPPEEEPVRVPKRDTH
jgi:hypothetical protein